MSTAQRYALNVNGVLRDVAAEPDTPLLWVLREALGLTGTKFGCGVGLCGACTVHLAGMSVKACMLPVAAIEADTVTTIEGLGSPVLHAVQRAWLEAGVSQCGYCQPGMIMAVAALLAETPNPTDAEIDAAVTNLCRCGTYARIRRAIRILAPA